MKWHAKSLYLTWRSDNSHSSKMYYSIGSVGKLISLPDFVVLFLLLSNFTIWYIITSSSDHIRQIEDYDRGYALANDLFDK